MRAPGLIYIQGRNGRAKTSKFAIAIHNTSNARLASARDEASYATHRTDGIGSHFYADNVETIQSIDTDQSVWHAGSANGNHNAVAVELVGVNAKPRQWWIDNINWRSLSYALAEVCRYYNIPVRRCTVEEMRKNPKVKGFYSHNDMRLAWGGTSHTDPGDNFPWDVLFQSINAVLGNQPPPTPQPEVIHTGLTVDGELGPNTISKWQSVMGTTVDGSISKPSELVRAVQRLLNAKIGAGLTVDGDGIRQDGKSYKTVRALQQYLGTTQDGRLSAPKSEAIAALQRRLNAGTFL